MPLIKIKNDKRHLFSNQELNRYVLFIHLPCTNRRHADNDWK